MISDERLNEISQCGDVSKLFAYEQRQMARELLALRNARGVPDGWKLVPVEPTRQMMSQGHFALGGTDRGKFRRIYQAMLAAAPEVGK